MIKKSFFNFLLVLFVFLASCNPTKNVPQGQYLLKSYEVKIDNKNVNKDQLRSYVQQRPNKKILGARFHLWLYNSSNLDKTNWWNEGLRKNGEEPVIWHQSRNNRTKDELGLFLKSKGYYYAEVTDTVIFKKRKAEVIYRIKTGWPYTVNKIAYLIPDTAIAKLVLADTVNSLIKSGMLVDEDILRAECRRIETNLKNQGYFRFSRDYINCLLDTYNLERKADLYFRFRPHTEPTLDNQVVEVPYPKYNVSSMTVNASLSMQNLLETANMHNESSDTLKHGEVKFIIQQDFPVKASTINNSIFIYTDSLYRISDVNQTYQHLNGLRNFQQINIAFTERPGQIGETLRELDCVVSLLPFPRQKIEYELSGTNSEGNFGGGLWINHYNRSLLGHAEFFDLNLRGLVEAVSGEGIQFNTKMEYEAEASLNVPKFLLPFRSDQFTQKYNPKTTFSILYNYQQYPEYYVRTVFSTSFRYNWRGIINNHFVKPLDIYFVQLPYLDDRFQNVLNRYPYLKNSYQAHMVVSSSYTFVRDMRLANKDDGFFFRTNIENAGLLLNAAYRASGQKKLPEKPFLMFGNSFSQFIKGDVDLRYFHTINENNKLVSRLFAGMGFPYGNSKTTAINDDNITKTVAAMPFEKKYYAGGANSTRGWRLRSLGPGSYRDTTSLTSYPNNTGDIKLEANLEYRFKLLWLLEGALFIDAGNVWDSYKDNDRPGANFSFDRFYREISLSGGLGFRFDFTFVILRADLGMKLHDPVGAGRWAFTPKPNGNRRVHWEDFCLSIGIGYPFF